MTSLTHQIARERRALAEAWRNGFMTGATLVLLVVAPIVILMLVMGAGK
ncbi:MAG: hypothetical protein IPM64_17365 [Phycisphaerales bacterium]|nr:hypothetical protein [Phycisphaerales bacterium]